MTTENKPPVDNLTNIINTDETKLDTNKKITHPVKLNNTGEKISSSFGNSKNQELRFPIVKNGTPGVCHISPRINDSEYKQIELLHALLFKEIDITYNLNELLNNFNFVEDDIFDITVCLLRATNTTAPFYYCDYIKRLEKLPHNKYAHFLISYCRSQCTDLDNVDEILKYLINYVVMGGTVTTFYLCKVLTRVSNKLSRQTTRKLLLDLLRLLPDDHVLHLFHTHITDLDIINEYIEKKLLIAQNDIMLLKTKLIKVVLQKEINPNAV